MATIPNKRKLTRIKKVDLDATVVLITLSIVLWKLHGSNFIIHDRPRYIFSQVILFIVDLTICERRDDKFIKSMMDYTTYL